MRTVDEIHEAISEREEALEKAVSRGNVEIVFIILDQVKFLHWTLGENCWPMMKKSKNFRKAS